MTELASLLEAICKKAPRTIGISGLSLCLMVAAGCNGGYGSSSSSSITVKVASSASSITAGQTADITATVAYDSSNMGVTWSVSGGGTLSNQTSTTAVYNAPSSVTANTTVTITATSVANTSVSAYVMITVTPAAAITVKITDPITTVAAGAAAVTLNATVQNDSTNSGVTWTLTAGGANCMSTTCGTLSSATTTSVVYTPPAGTPASPYNAPTITATSIANTSASATDPFTITAPASLPISVSLSNTFTTIAAGAAGITLTATVQNDPTGDGVSWTLTTGGADCSTTCGTLSSATTTSVVYTPPSSVPASPDNAPTITATSIADTVVTATDAFTITSTTANHDGMLKGQYAFLAAGFGTTVLAGSITANGSGAITGGEEDIVSQGQTPSISASDLAITSGTYTVDTSDNRATLTYTDANKNTFTFALALGSVSNGVATKGQMIDENYLVTGSLALQSPAAFSTSALTGSYAFGFPGWNGSLEPEVSVGSFTMNNGILSNGLMDMNDYGTLTAAATLTGSISGSIDSSGRGTFNFTVQGEAGTGTETFYVVSAGKFFAIVNNGNGSASYGEILQQSGGPYSLASLNGATIVSEQSGGGQNPPDDTLGIGTFNGSGTGSFSFDQIQGSGSDQQTTGTATIVLDSAANGRFTITPPGSSIILYMIAPNQAFLLDTATDPGFGFIEPQTAGTYSNSMVQGSFFFGTLPLVSPPASGLSYSSGVVTVSSAGAISGTSDEFSNGTFTSGNSISGSLTLAGNGRATTSSGDNVIYFASPTKFYILTIPSGGSDNPTIGTGEQ